jgi:hypothetical protein
MPDLPIRIAFLKKMHLFRGLSDEQLSLVAEAIQEQAFDEEETVFVQGTTTDTFYIIYSGSVDIIGVSKSGKKKKITSLFRGDYFGEQSLLNKRSHNATVQASKGTLLFKLYRNKFLEFIRTISDLNSNFEIMIQSRTMARKLRFPWLNENEIVYFLSRKHVFVLYQMLIGPVMGLALVLAAFWLSFVIESAGLAGVSGFLLVLALLWGLWQYVDWSNDYYIVSNQRVVRIDKVVAMYDSREESPMNTIVSVNSESDLFGRIFRYGTVIVRTITGEMRMSFAPRPRHAVAMIEEYLLRTKEVQRQQDEEIMRDAIRRKLGLAPPPAPAPAPEPAAEPAAGQKKPRKPSLGSAIGQYIREIFYARKEVGGTVTYHKHWIVLVWDVILQTIVLLGLISIYPLWYYFFETSISLAGGSIVAFLIVATLVWWVYGFLDWRNDLYQVTPEQIMDIYRVPFGDEDRKSAPLENILSTNYERNGFIGLLFNFGNVNIQVGTLNFDFINVADPPSVQKDIVQRMNARIQKKRQTDSAAERERMAEWLAMYHNTMNDIEKQAGQTPGSDSG